MRLQGEKQPMGCFLLISAYSRPTTMNSDTSHSTLLISSSLAQNLSFNRSNQLTQCRTQFKSFGVIVLGVLRLHDNVSVTFK